MLVGVSFSCTIEDKEQMGESELIRIVKYSSYKLQKIGKAYRICYIYIIGKQVISKQVAHER